MFGHCTFSYILLVRTEKTNLIFVCNICSDITHFVCIISSGQNKLYFYSFVSNMGSDLHIFVSNISSVTRHHIFVYNIGSHILYFRM